MRFSIVVPVYNVEKYLCECVDSVLAQSFDDFELILVDDGSTDASKSIIETYAEKSEKIKPIYKTNGGVMSAWLAGIEVASGEYVLSLDSDDYWQKDLLERCEAVIAESKPDTLVFAYKTFNSTGSFENKLGIKGGLYNKAEIENKVYPTLINAGCFDNRSCIYLSRVNKVIKRELLLANMQYYVKGYYFGEDNLCAIPNVLDSNSIYVFENYYPYFYRTNPTSLTHSYHEGLWQQFVDLNTLTLKILADKKCDELSKQVYADSVFHAAISISNVVLGNVPLRKSIKGIKSVISSEFVRKGLKYMDKSRCSKKDLIYLCLIKLKFASAIYFAKKLITRVSK